MSQLSIFSPNYFKNIIKPQLVIAISNCINSTVWQVPTTLIDIVADYSNNIDYPFDINDYTYRRIKNEYLQFVEAKLIENPTNDCFIEENSFNFKWKIDVINVLEWRLCIVPINYPYTDGYFYFQLKFPNDNQNNKQCYPLEHVHIKSLTKIYSFLVSKEGLIALSCFREKYDVSIATNINKIVIYIYQYIFTFDVDKTCCCIDQDEVIKMYENNRKAYLQNAKQWTKLYAAKDQDV